MGFRTLVLLDYSNFPIHSHCTMFFWNSFFCVGFTAERAKHLIVCCSNSNFDFCRTWMLSMHVVHTNDLGHAHSNFHNVACAWFFLPTLDYARLNIAWILFIIDWSDAVYLSSRWLKPRYRDSTLFYLSGPTEKYLVIIIWCNSLIDSLLVRFNLTIYFHRDGWFW